MTGSTLANHTPIILVGATTNRNGAIVAPWGPTGWRNFANQTREVGFYKDVNGHCHLRGFGTGGWGGYADQSYAEPLYMFQLPLGFRPAAIERFTCACYPGGVRTADITIPALNVSGSGSGTDSNGDSVSVSISGATAEEKLVDPPIGSTWVDVLPDSLGGYVVPWHNANLEGHWVSLSGITFLADH